MREVQIVPQQQGKGRTFRAVLLAAVEADLLWSGGMTATENQRPVWAMFAGSDQELRAFMANLTGGRKASLVRENQGYSRRKDECLEILKSAGYATIWQREAEGSLATIYLPDLFQLDPGMVDPSGIRFILLPTREWAEAQTLDVKPLVQYARRLGYSKLEREQLAQWAPLSFLFCAYLDRRTRCPLVSDGRFYFQLMLACLDSGLASLSTHDVRYRDYSFGEHKELRYSEIDTANVGLLPGLVFRSDHETLERVLAEQVALFFRVTQGSH